MIITSETYKFFLIMKRVQVLTELGRQSPFNLNHTVLKSYCSVKLEIVLKD